MTYITKEKLQNLPEALRNSLGEKEWTNEYSLYIDFLGNNRCDLYIIYENKNKEKEIRKLVEDLDHIFKGIDNGEYID